MVSLGSLEITDRNKVPTRICSLGILFLIVISKETYDNHIFLRIVARENEDIEIRFPLEYSTRNLVSSSYPISRVN
jgi:hypothetical protein